MIGPVFVAKRSQIGKDNAGELGAVSAALSAQREPNVGGGRECLVVLALHNKVSGPSAKPKPQRQCRTIKPPERLDTAAVFERIDDECSTKHRFSPSEQTSRQGA